MTHEENKKNYKNYNSMNLKMIGSVSSFIRELFVLSFAFILKDSFLDLLIVSGDKKCPQHLLVSEGSDCPLIFEGCFCHTL